MMLIVDIEKRLSGFTLKVQLKAEGSNAFIGPSGCGKSVTLKCIAGIMKPDRGRIIYNDRILFDSEKHVNLPPQKRNVGYMFQNYALFPDMTVRENILAGLIWEKDRTKKLRIFDEAVSLLHIENLLDSKPYALSGGEAQRTALARMIVNKPDLLLFDEPFSALDVFLKEEIKAEFKSIIDKLGNDYIIVTHSMDEAYSLSDHLFIIDNGQVIGNGNTEEVFSQPESIKAASVMGYRNIAEAVPSDDGSVLIPEWNLETISNGRTDIKAACISENDIRMDKSGYSARIIEKITSPDHDTLGIIIEGGTGKLWMKCPKNFAKDIGEIKVAINPEDIKLLSS